MSKKQLPQWNNEAFLKPHAFVPKGRTDVLTVTGLQCLIEILMPFSEDPNVLRIHPDVAAAHPDALAAYEAGRIDDVTLLAILTGRADLLPADGPTTAHGT